MKKRKKKLQVVVLVIVLVSMCVIFSLHGQSRLDAHLAASVKSAAQVHGNVDARIDANSVKRFDVDDKVVISNKQDNDRFTHSNSTVGADLVAEADNDGNSTRRTIVYSCNVAACGGWADRQKGIVSAYVLSVLMDRSFKLYMPRPCDLTTVMAPNQVDWRLRLHEIKSRILGRVHGFNAKYTYELVKRMLNESDLNIAETDAEFVIVSWNMEVVHLLRTHPRAQRVPWLASKMSTAQVYRHVLGLLMEPRPAIQAQLQAVLSARPPGTKLACAHIRTGDDAEDLRGWRFFNTLESLHVLFHFLQQFNDSQRYRIFFASDKKQVLAMAKARFPAVFLTTPGPITHVDLDHSKDACAGLAHAILDQLVLATCDVLVISRSGLGKIAAFLRDTDDALYLFHGFKITSYRRDNDFGNRLW